MWPWEHLAVGYVAFATLSRVFDWTVDDATAVALAVGTQFPDIVDKPLAWTFDVLPSGTSLAHSVLVAVPVSAAVVVASRRVGRPTVGAAFAVGYLLHLPADALFGPLFEGGSVSFGYFLWPLVAQTPGGGTGLLAKVAYYLGEYRAFLQTPRLLGYLVFEAALLGAAFVLWVRDGTPGVGVVGRLRSRVGGN